MKKQLLTSVAAIAVVLGTSAPADAFCGFYVGGAGGELYNNATMVVLMRDGTRTVLSIRNNYQGPPKDFAMVVPVPVVLKKENVKTLPAGIFARVDRLAAPRLVEYWEQDPCPTKRPVNRRPGAGGIQSLTKTGYAAGKASKPKVKVEARFVVGEYEIVILSASEATALETWITGHGYKIPTGAAPYLRPYVQKGSKFFVARVNPKKVKFHNGMATLSPLRFHYDDKKLTLPVRLGLINARGAQDLIVHVLAKGMRYELANYPNAYIPTNLFVADGVRNQFASFYAALFDATLEKNPGAVVTEYSWDTNTCDPCPSKPLGLAELETLGLDVVDPPRKVPEMRSIVRPLTPKVSGELNRLVVRRYVARKYRELRGCYERAAGVKPSLAGQMKVSFTISNGGRVNKAKLSGMRDGSLERCVRNVVKALTFPKAKKQGSTTVTMPIMFRRVPIGRAAAARGWVLTRLHARYTRKSLGEDLIFREARAIRGGQGGGADNIPKGVVASSRNTFQGRYIIRHEWTGPIGCKNPRRGRWGGPPPGTKGSTDPLPALDVAFVRQRKQPLTKLVRGQVDYKRQPVLGTTRHTRAAASHDPPESPATHVDPRDKGEGRPGCGCGSGSGADAGLLLLALAVMLGLRKRLRGASSS
jgi:hypothetical protein